MLVGAQWKRLSEQLCGMNISSFEYPLGGHGHGDTNLTHSEGAKKIKTRSSLVNEQWDPEQQRETNILSSTRSAEKHPHERQGGLAAGTPTGSFHSFPCLKVHASGHLCLET